MTKKETKARIIEAGARIIHKKGFNNTGIQEILDAAKVPKGSFYFYFKNKEDFGLQLIDYFERYFTEMVSGLINDKTMKPLERFDRILSTFQQYFESTEFQYGCPIGNLAQEMGDLNQPFRDRLKHSIDAMAAVLEELLAEAVAAGDISGNIEPKTAAHFIVSSWHGALMHMKVYKSPEPLEIQKRFVIDYLLKA